MMKLEKIQKDDYLKVRHAMIAGARTIEEVKEMTDVDTVECENDIKAILASVCGCKNVTLEQVVTLANEGKTVEEVKEITGAATACGRCIRLVEAIVEAKK